MRSDRCTSLAERSSGFVVVDSEGPTMRDGVGGVWGLARRVVDGEWEDEE